MDSAVLPGDAALDQNLGYWCRGAVAAFPDKVAIIDMSQPQVREITYARLDERLDRVAAMLVSAGLKSGDRVAVSLTNRVEFIEAVFGAMRAGIVPVPLNTKLGPDTLRFVLEDCGCAGAIAELAANKAVPGLVDAMQLAVRIAVDGPLDGWPDYEALLKAAALPFNPDRLPAGHLALLPYTSGSSGMPKGVRLTHEGQCWWVACQRRYWPAAPDSRGLVAVPLYHKNAMAGTVKPLLAQGGSFVLLPGFEPRRFLDVLSRYKCTRATAVPAVYLLLLQQRDLLGSLDFSSLQSLGIGSAPTPVQLLEAVEAAFGVPVSEGYGLTEGGPVMMGPALDGTPTPRGSCGRPWPEGEVRLVDADGNDSQTLGELLVRNPGVTAGYHNLPQVTRERITDGWLHTGDLFARDANGFFYFRGRTDDMFNAGGENVYPVEVESILLKHPAVAEVSVVSVPHAIKGSVPVAMVVRARGHSADEQEIRQFSLDNGPAYSHPRRIVFVDVLPLNGPGKIDRKKVEREMRERFPQLG